MRILSSFWKDHQELEGFGRKLINDLERTAHVRCRRQNKYRVYSILPIVLILGFLVAMGFSSFFHHAPTPLNVANIIAGIVMVSGQFLLIVLQARLFRDQLRLELIERGIAPSVCFDCKYDLRGVSSANCPECGTFLGEPPDEDSADDEIGS